MNFDDQIGDDYPVHGTTECPGCGGYNVLVFLDGVEYCECWECGEAWCPSDDQSDRAMTEAELKTYFDSLDRGSS